ncbi:uncharacterized protein [Primulina eburnea]|uniref:uncharacterized protein isoform X2 n=1 Tax=Primulina eburnea TaxID=1245227 RepID=UPI003C6C4C2F
MANPGSKFVSANLNKSYGQQQQQLNGGGGGYQGQASAAGWGRGGGGMLVLSKNRGSAQKAGSKLSVPPPLNLPSLRKEHERFDTSNPSRGIAPGSGAKHSSSRVGWTKPVSVAALSEKNESNAHVPLADVLEAKDGVSRGTGSYVPPSARSNGLGLLGSSSGSVSRDFLPSTQKTMVLRGEDFPSLQAARPVSSEASQKQKESLNQKQKQIVGEELNQKKRDVYHSGSLVNAQPSGQPSWNSTRNFSVEKSGEGRGIGRGGLAAQTSKEDEYFASPLPLVRLNPRSDWADDERDTSHRFTERERGRDAGYSKIDSYWDGNLDLLRPSFLTHKVAQSPYDRWGQRGNEAAGFDERDIFSGGLVGVIRKKRDAAKSTDFHDPIRESFQAELERVQKMQELERHRIIVEQEKALELARREEEDRQRRIREEEERQRRVEEESREAAWRAEHERVEAIRIAEENRIAREEEMRRIYMEEERRKQAAKQKLLDLEAKIAKREAQLSTAARGNISAPNKVNDEQLEASVKEKDFSRTLDSWEDGERMVDKLTTSASFDPFAPSRPYEMSWRPYPPSEGSSNFFDGGKGIIRRDAFENGGSFFPSALDQEIDYYSPRRDAFGRGRAASRAYSNVRARNSMRQPRVLPPPSLNSSQRAPFERPNDRSGPLAVLGDEIRYTNFARSLPIGQTFYDGGNQKGLELPEVEVKNITPEDHIQKNKSRCDSQSSLSVSSPPNSPPQLSHDELDGFEDSPVKAGIADVKGNILSESGSVVLNGKSGTGASVSGFSSEDEEWTIENDDTLQHQEEYDEDEDGYTEEDEVRDGDDENLELNEKFEVLEFEETEPSDMVDNVVLGFDEGVEVVIPSDDFENSSRTQDRTYGIPDISGNVGEKRGLVDEVPAEERGLLNVNDMSDISANSSSVKIKESDLILESSIGQSVDASYSCRLDLLDCVDSLGSTGLPVQQSVTCSGDATAAVGQNSISSISSAGSPTDLPVKLQFGLFSGPSLIPSPVPAIQIGSIQMPLHIHLPLGQSFTYMDPSQPPVFQFGQMQYTSPISQGILPMPPQSKSFMKPNMQAKFNLNQRAGDSMYNQPARDVSAQNVAEFELNKLPGLVSGLPEQSHGSLSVGINSVLEADSRADHNIGRTTFVSSATDKEMESKALPRMEEGNYGLAPKNYSPSSEEKKSESQMKIMQQPVQAASGDKVFTGPRRLDRFYGCRRNNNSYILRHADTRSSFTTHGMPANSTGFPRRSQRTVQHTEFRIWENIDRGKGPLMVSFKDSDLDDNPSYTGKAMGDFRRSWSKRGTISNRPLKHRTKVEVSDNIDSQVVNPGDMVAKEMGKNISFKSRNISYPTEANLPKKVSEDVDAPLLKGIVRVYEQPGIEAPSDEDDFIEVRSKRQMLNDRRDQREKEIKAKSTTTKSEKIKAKSHTTQPPCKLHAPKPNSIVPGGPSKLAMPYENQESCLDVTVSESHQLAHDEVSTGFATSVFQPLAPIGTPINSEAQTIKPQTGSMTVVSSGEKGCESKNNGTNQIQLSSTSWSTSGINQQVMSLTQTKLEEATKPMRYNSHNSIVGGHSSTASDAILPTMSISAKEKTFSSGASPINSLLAGEKIQFGAVTSPSVLPPSSRAVSHGIGAPGSNRNDVPISRNFSVAENGSSLFFGKENQSADGCVPLQDCEAEAEASAAAICVDDLVRNGLGTLSAVNVPDTKTFTGPDIDVITTGVIGGQQLVNESKCEESLTVSLPADLSVETTQISVWSPLPSSSGQMPSHFSSGPSHLPFYEVNPILGSPLLAFGPHEESSGTLSQPQKSTAPSSGPIGNWQQWHSDVDSFYNPPAGYPGRLINRSGGIPGVQGGPHMVVYNHFAPVGQFGQYGQFGLSFMGTTFIPSGHTSTSVQVNEGDIHSINTTSTQHNASNMMAPIRHLPPGSPLKPMASPLPMFNLSPFQSAPDISVQAQWGDMPTSNGSVSTTLQPQVEAEIPSQVNHGHSVDHPVNVSMFAEPPFQTSSDNVPSFSVATESNIAPFSAELGLVDSMRSTGVVASGQSMVIHSSSYTESGKAGTPPEDSLDNHNSKHRNTSSVKTQILQKNLPIQQVKSAGHSHQRGGVSHRNNAGNEWSHRRTGFHGRSHSSGVDRGFPASKIKQIYVAKTEC